jgi:hypothetical protein
MHHCVSTYARRAECGDYAVFSVAHNDERATLGVTLWIDDVGSERKPSYRLRAVLDQVRGICNFPVSAPIDGAARDWVSRLNGIPLLREHYEFFRRNKLAAGLRTAATERWRVVFHERVRELTWGMLSAETRAGSLGWGDFLSSRIAASAAPAAGQKQRRPDPLNQPDTPGPYDDFLTRWD